jgi:sugar phosphate isomerase/epimerase
VNDSTRSADRDGAGLRRRDFIAGLGAAAGGIALAGPLLAQGTPASAARKRNIKLGFDNFSIRALGWKAEKLLEHAASLRLDTLFISDLQSYESLDDKHLREVKAKADDLGIEIHAGTGGVCPTARRVMKEFGTPEEHLKLLIRVARALGSPVARCYLGSMEDRRGGIERHIESLVQTLKAVRSQAVDAGVKIAVENHAGDMQAWELAGLVESAGKDFVGVTVDSGNATWALEDPLENLRILGPYSVTSGIRDSMVWEEGPGVKVQWTAMGDGCVDLKAYMDEYEKLCPRAPVQLEIISGFARPFPYLEKEFWKEYPKARASDLAAFLALAKRGKPLPSYKAPPGADPKEAERSYQKDELERSVRYSRETLGLGLK